MEQYQLEEVKFNKDTVMEYLEEVVLSGIADDFEEEFYEDVKWGRKPCRKQYAMIIHKMKDLYHEKY